MSDYQHHFLAYGCMVGLPPPVLALYLQIFRGALEYACSIFVWHDNFNIFLQLKRLQYKTIRVTLGYRQSTPINLMLCKARFLLKCMSKKNPVLLLIILINNLKRLERILLTGKQRRSFSRNPLLLNFISTLTNTNWCICIDLTLFQRLNAIIRPSSFVKNFANLWHASKIILIVKSLRNHNLQDLDSSILVIYTDGSRILKNGCAGILWSFTHQSLATALNIN